MTEKPNAISTMLNMINKVKALKQVQPKTQAIFNEFLGKVQLFMRTLEKLYPNDKNDILLRTGNEVFIDLRKL